MAAVEIQPRAASEDDEEEEVDEAGLAENAATRAGSALARCGIDLTNRSMQNLSWAEGVFHGALERDPQYVRAHFGLASSSVVRGDIRAAETSFLAALKVDPVN